jgi:hypothetical protein
MTTASERPAPPTTAQMRGWTPKEHIDAACDLLEAQMNRTGGGYVITPVWLTQAQVHIAIAEAKMHGRMRA